MYLDKIMKFLDSCSGEMFSHYEVLREVSHCSESYIKPLECCFTLKWFHVIIVLIKCDSREPFLIVRCDEWGEFLIQQVCVFQRNIIW